MGKKKCFIVRDFIMTRMSYGSARWVGDRWQTPSCVYMVSPQLKSMWKLALKNKRGKAAIAEVCPETWVPYVYDSFDECVGMQGTMCEFVTHKVRRLMTAKDLK